MPQTLRDVAANHQARRNALAEAAAAAAVRQFRGIAVRDLDAGWVNAEQAIVAAVTSAQLTAATQATPYTNKVAALMGAETEPARLVVLAFANVTREGREVGPELYSSVTLTKRLIGAGQGVGRAFEAGTALLSILAANIVRDTGRSADRTIATSKGFTYSVRVISPGACSRCAVLAGVKGYRTDFDRHPRCKCTSMPLMDTETPKGFHRSPDEYFDSLSKAEQDRVFTKSGAEAIRLGADPAKVVNARRGAPGISYSARGTGRATPGRLQPVTIGRKADGSPLQVYATNEGVTSRGGFGRAQTLNANVLAGDRYRRTSTLRLMPEQIVQMSDDPARIRELLKKYGYVY